jgi:hypothetical protein
MKNINWKKWSIRLGIIGFIIISTIIPSIFENVLNRCVSWGEGSLICGLILFALLMMAISLIIFLMGLIIECESYNSDLALNVTIYGIVFVVILGLLFMQKKYDLSEEITIMKNQQLVDSTYEQKNYCTLDNIEVTSKIQTNQFDVEILETKEEKSGTIHKVKFNQDDSEPTIILMDAAYYNEAIGEGFSSITGDIHTLKLKIPFNIAFRKNSNGSKFCICKEYLYLDLTRYLFLGEKSFSDEEIQKIKEQFINAALEYKNGNKKSFDVFLDLDNIQVVQSGVSEITINEMESTSYMWNSTTAKKTFKELNLKVQPLIESEEISTETPAVNEKTSET